VKDNFRQKSITAEVQTALLAAGVPADRLPKAVKFFMAENAASIDFEFTDEAKLEYSIDGIAEAVEAFKKENDFLFVEGDPNPNPSGFQPTKRPPKGTPAANSTEKAKEEFKKRFPRVFGY